MSRSFLLASLTCCVERTLAELELMKHPTSTAELASNIPPSWRYKTLADPPIVSQDAPSQCWETSLYRGLVPAANIDKRDFAINGAVVGLRAF